ncbi:Malonyl-CoA O-methyltransferase BioC [Chromobacterium violaceum]|uniref:Malonyl-CoA O-methyltransferase BioC n=1 Tax=Chromobacterium violaceum TaxID=536 RepID=A0A3S4HRJ9_CHRVL|nr:Malonyl-CoA O-methyltransferase BioC [Chromobacterium violaceum]
MKKLFKPSLPWQINADIEKLPLADASVDMIWSNLTIQWINVPDKMFAELRRVLKPDGMLMFSTLGRTRCPSCGRHSPVWTAPPTSTSSSTCTTSATR